MRNLNRCMFIGRLGQDPETRYLPSGEAVTNLSLAVSDDYKDKNTGQKVDQTEWIRVSAFGKLAEIMSQYLTKGSKVFISGKMRTRSWEKEGVKQYSTEIVAQEMEMLDSKPDGQQRPAQQQSRQAQGSPQQGGQPDWDDSDIAF